MADPNKKTTASKRTRARARRREAKRAREEQARQQQAREEEVPRHALQNDLRIKFQAVSNLMRDLYQQAPNPYDINDTKRMQQSARPRWVRTRVQLFHAMITLKAAEEPLLDCAMGYRGRMTEDEWIRVLEQVMGLLNAIKAAGCDKLYADLLGPELASR
ncbi:hypothetical protein CGCS363_v002396 [Colletotrichum siamense]|uniref:uncharacterized protein n=1 Tax=Colletotrichum siamense TaxID=690259 RepID=UPI001872BAC1|nr:uncharacterized protein CGCS363_v002396 [Colletotrichum siamense]KAF5509947.1 hypothetical protein CGCS363_v002396 [Colletotrichum siamense]